jgi:hypothetical protein
VKGSAAEAQLVLLVFREKKLMLQKTKDTQKQKDNAAEAQLVLVLLRMLNYGSFKKADGFPIGLKKKNSHKLSSE